MPGPDCQDEGQQARHPKPRAEFCRHDEPLEPTITRPVLNGHCVSHGGRRTGAHAWSADTCHVSPATPLAAAQAGRSPTIGGLRVSARFPAQRGSLLKWGRLVGRACSASRPTRRRACTPSCKSEDCVQPPCPTLRREGAKWRGRPCGRPCSSNRTSNVVLRPSLTGVNNESRRNESRHYRSFTAVAFVPPFQNWLGLVVKYIARSTAMPMLSIDSMSVPKRSPAGS